MSSTLDRTGLRKGWAGVVLFLVLVTLPTTWVLLRPATQVQALAGSLIASVVVGVVGWVCLRHDGGRARDVGLGRRGWRHGLAVFAGWWALVTLVDLGSRPLLALFGLHLAPLEPLVWAPLVLLDFAGRWLAVGFGEEIAFRGYLHNKLVAQLSRHWLALILAALLFGLWHIPGAALQGNRAAIGLLLNSLVFGAISLALFNAPYEWTGLLPFFALFHGWSDFPLLANLQRPSAVGAVAGYLLLFLALWVYKRLERRADKPEVSGTLPGAAG